MNYPNYSVDTVFAPLPLWAFIIGVIGLLVFICSYGYGVIKTYQTKNTSQTSIWMWTITIIGAASLDIFFLLGIILTHGSLSFSIMFALETIALLETMYIFIIKIRNVACAKKQNMTEKQYCQKLYENYLAKKSLANDKIDTI